MIVVQGVGNYSLTLCSNLHKEGAKLILNDINKEAVNRAVEAFGARAVDPDDIYSVDCDIYSPCALGATLNDETLSVLKAKVIAGSANNQLKTAKHGDIINEQGIVRSAEHTSALQS